jgi:L-threonylcarbamoyladenylate synthase
MAVDSDERSIQGAAKIVANGGIIAFRTDTLYGLGADPFNRDAVQRIKQLKGREEAKPILIVISDREQVDRFVSGSSRTFDLLAMTFWPGPLTLICKASAEVPEEITAGTETVGLRLPGDDKVRLLVQACGGALTATSANPAHQDPAKSAQEVFTYFGDAVDLIVDGGAAGTDQPSTVVDVCGDEPRLVREGVIPWSKIQSAIDQIKKDQG